MTEMLVRAAVTEATGAPPDPAPWCEEFDETLVCAEVLQVTHDVKSFVLRPTSPRRFVFEPGQHLTVHADIAGRAIDRCYTIASSPLQPATLTITVKRVPDGPVSNWLHDHVQPGDPIAVSGPLGSFTTARHRASKYLFLSAGSGITPLMSMARTIRDRAEPVDVIFVHNARTPDDIIFRDELQRMAVESAGIHVVTICEHDAPREQWTGLRGRLTLPMLQAIAPDLTEREVLTCGPSAYMAGARTILADAGADLSRCHEESFTLGEDAVPAPRPARLADRGDRHDGFAIEFRRTGRTIECGSDSTILMAAARAGLTVPSSCGEGVCGTCKTTLVSGTVDMEHHGGIRPREIAQNKVLLCCSIPQEDVVLDA